ncbi:uncharacterized protein MONOS_18224 [Monocercomonoides exilis]|uniref:uncharacterized protein n=1 Tax=Monocercomonoides exilis TaxID=2049356 RepID=UPI00355A01D0|nr:hypothetical protein MONOS_18224 [Monocercomonoides exilis]
MNRISGGSMLVMGNICTNTFLTGIYSVWTNTNNRQHVSFCSRSDKGAIPDLRSFFREAWATGICHDRFPAFLSALETELMEKTEF